jgi:solute carrier family 35 protein C2
MTALPLRSHPVSSSSPSSSQPLPSSSTRAPASDSPERLLIDDSLSVSDSDLLETAAGPPSGTARVASTSNSGASGGSQTVAGPSRERVARSVNDEDESESDWDIEMEPIAGHRRRRSSHNMAVRPAGSPSRLRDTSRGPTPGNSTIEPKISEENLDANGFAIGKDESGDDSLTDEDLQDDEETGLTRKDKQRRQKKRSRNTQLDQRIARDRKDISKEERKEADKAVFRSLIVNVVLILLWYLFSLSISIVSYAIASPFLFLWSTMLTLFTVQQMDVRS